MQLSFSPKKIRGMFGRRELATLSARAKEIKYGSARATVFDLPPMRKGRARGKLVHRLVQAAVNRWSVVRFHDFPFGVVLP